MKSVEFLGSALIPAPLLISPTEYVIMLGSLLSLKNVSSAVLWQNKTILGTIYGYQIVFFLLELPADQIYANLWVQAGLLRQNIPTSQMPVCGINDPFERILKGIVATRFGDVLITNEDGLPIGVLSLPQIMMLLAQNIDNVNMKLREVASPLKLIEEQTPLDEIMRFMVRHRIRRGVFKKGDKYYGFTEREILRILFSARGLELLRDNPRSLLESASIETLAGMQQELPIVSGDIDVAEVWSNALKAPGQSVIVDNKMIATPWDLVIKPYLEGKLSLFYY